MQSQLLTEFYNAYNDWLEAGAPDGVMFHREVGLCSNIASWGNSTKFDHVGGDPAFSTVATLRYEMTMQFDADGLSKHYPFGNLSEYTDCRNNSTQHLDPKRIAWVKAHLV